MVGTWSGEPRAWNSRVTVFTTYDDGRVWRPSQRSRSLDAEVFDCIADEEGRGDGRRQNRAETDWVKEPQFFFAFTNRNKCMSAGVCVNMSPVKLRGNGKNDPTKCGMMDSWMWKIMSRPREWMERKARFLDGKNQPVKNQYFATEVQMCIAEMRGFRWCLSALMQMKPLMTIRSYFGILAF